MNPETHMRSPGFSLTSMSSSSVRASSPTLKVAMAIDAQHCFSTLMRRGSHTNRITSCVASHHYVDPNIQNLL